MNQRSPRRRRGIAAKIPAFDAAASGALRGAMPPRWSPLLVVPLLALGVAEPLGAEKVRDGRRTIAVTGRGEVRATPDRAALSFAVDTTGPRAADAATENARRSTAVAAALRSVLGAQAAVGTARYSVEPRYESTRPGE